ncbi:MAG: lipopolysaccharide biosynthesis protein [Scytonematopsis contorta HA4267-MV1]|nr:lipopolysaccharide biosynthesis protein [Scytonematopsis contorta HA4267-MV1]
MKRTLLIKGGFWISFSTIILRFVNLLSNLILARLLLPSEFGVVGIAYVFWSFFILFTQDGPGSFIVYKGTEDKRYLNTAYTISLLIGLFFALVMVVSAPFTATFFNEPSLTWILIAFAFNLLLSSIFNVQVAVMTRQMQYQNIAVANIVTSIVRVIFTTTSALLGMSYWSFVIGDTASWVTGCILTRYQCGCTFRLLIDPEVKSEVLSYCFAVTGSSFGFYFNANADNFTVGKLLGSTSLGYYNLAYQLTMALSTILNSVISQIGMPVFAQLDSDEERKNVLYNVVEQIAFLTAPIYALFFLVIDRNAIALMFGENWIPLCTVIPWLLIFAYFRLINAPLNTMLSAVGRPDANAKVNICIAPIAVVSFIIGARYGGIVGVSIAVALVLGIFWTFCWWWFGCRVLNWSMMHFLQSSFIPVLIAIPALVLSIYLPTLIKPITFIVIYLLSVRLLQPKQIEWYQKIITKTVNKLIAQVTN